jgi:TRAP-type C4-dicarboxylate transport system permease small subunit
VKGVGAPPREASDGIEGQLNAPLSEAAARELGRDAQASPVSHGLARPLSWPFRVVDEFEEIVAGIALLIVVGSVGWGVLSRYVSRQPAAWAGEVAILAFAWLIFFGAAACFKHGLHPSIDMLVTRLPTALARGVNLSAHLCVIAFCGLMVYLGVIFSHEAWTDPTPVLRLPYTVVYGPVTLGFALMLARHLEFLWRHR